jgi:hypothetical protein
MEIREMIDKVKNFGKTTVYKCVDGFYDKNKSGFDYLATNLDYSKHFGDKCYEITLDTSNYRILKLDKWNKLYTEKTGKNGNMFNRQQGLFIIGDMAITSNYSQELKLFSQALGEELTNKFLDELNNCDAIYGEDAGYVGEFVFAVKNKDMIINIEVLSQYWC